MIDYGGLVDEWIVVCLESFRVIGEYCYVFFITAKIEVRIVSKNCTSQSKWTFQLIFRIMIGEEGKNLS